MLFSRNSRANVWLLMDRIVNVQRWPEPGEVRESFDYVAVNVKMQFLKYLLFFPGNCR